MSLERSHLPSAGLQELQVSKEEEASSLNEKVQDLEGAAAKLEVASQLQLKRLERQVAELRDIIDSSMHTKRASTLKLETAMNALNLSKGDAKRFIQVRSCSAELSFAPQKNNKSLPTTARVSAAHYSE